MNIITVEKCGRYKYYKIASPQVALIIENMANLLPNSYDRSVARKLENDGTRYARTCYDYLAGRLGVDIAAAMIQKGILLECTETFSITDRGREWFDCWEKGNYLDLPLSDHFTHTSPYGTIKGKEAYD